MTAIVPVQGPGAVAPAPTRLLRPIARPAELLAAQDETRAAVKELLKEDRDFGVIPGVKKPSLLQPGAERICLAFGVLPRFKVVEKEVDHDRENVYEQRGRPAGTSFGLYRYVVECELVLRETNEVVGSGLASCSTLESKYISRPRDSENTVLQMAEKRAFVRATRTAFGLSDEFTQDVEDAPREAREDAAPAPRPAPPAPRPAPPAPKVPETLEEAKAFPFPYEKARGPNGNHGKPLGDLKIGYLKRAALWAVEQGRQEQDAGFLAAVGLLAAEEERAAEAAAPRLPLDGAPSSDSSAAAPAVEGAAPSSTTSSAPATAPITTEADPTSRYAVGTELAKLVKDERIPKSSRDTSATVLHNPRATLEQLTRQRDRLRGMLAAEGTGDGATLPDEDVDEIPF